MNLQTTARFAKEYERLPQRLQHRVDKALGLLLDNPRHPSLQIPTCCFPSERTIF